MKHFNFLLSFLLFIILFSCQNEINENRTFKPSEIKLERKVLSERESAYPFSLEREKKKIQEHCRLWMIMLLLYHF